MSNIHNIFIILSFIVGLPFLLLGFIGLIAYLLSDIISGIIEFVKQKDLWKRVLKFPLELLGSLLLVVGMYIGSVVLVGLIRLVIWLILWFFLGSDGIGRVY